MNEHRNYFHVTIFSYISLVYLSNDKSFWWQSHAMKNKNNFEKIKFEWLSRIRADKMLFSNLQRKSWHKIKGLYPSTTILQLLFKMWSIMFASIVCIDVLYMMYKSSKFLQSIKGIKMMFCVQRKCILLQEIVGYKINIWQRLTQHKTSSICSFLYFTDSYDVQWCTI